MNLTPNTINQTISATNQAINTMNLRAPNQPTNITYDAVIIGGGPGGYAAALRLQQLGGRVCLIEKKKVGGSCATVGCIPTKAGLYWAQLFSSLAEARKLNLWEGTGSINFCALQRYIGASAAQAVRGVEQLLTAAGVEVVYGTATIDSPTEISVDAGEEKSTGQQKNLTKIFTKNIIIATGSRPIPPPLAHKNILTSDEFLALKALPAALIIVGAGYVGLEFASLFSSLGSKVTVVELWPRILPEEDEEIGEELLRLLRAKGITILTNTLVEKLGGRAAEQAQSEDRSENLSEEPIIVQVLNKTSGKSSTLSAEKVLYAVGRRPVLPAELAPLGLTFTEQGISTDRSLRTNLTGIYAVGDVTGIIPLAHVAFRQGTVAAESIRGRESKIDYHAIPRCFYTVPEVASIGKISKGMNIKVGKFFFRANGRALTENQTAGFVKVYLEAAGGGDLEEKNSPKGEAAGSREETRLVGVSIIGAQASELIALAGSMLGKSYKEITEQVIAHPTLAEAVREAVLDAYGEALHRVKKGK